jgi:hypothetical protein
MTNRSVLLWSDRFLVAVTGDEVCMSPSLAGETRATAKDLPTVRVRRSEPTLAFPPQGRTTRRTNAFLRAWMAKRRSRSMNEVASDLLDFIAEIKA